MTRHRRIGTFRWLILSQMKAIHLKEFWEVLVSRQQAKTVFAIAQKEKFQLWNLILKELSFLQVLLLMNYFVKWFAQFGKVFKITNLKDNFFKNLIKQVIVGRKQLV